MKSLALLGLVLPAALAAQAPSPTPSSLLDSARARLARIDGTVTVPGLDSAVEVRRDRWGIPHIYARTRHDLFLAQGFVAAQDRLWQMRCGGAAARDGWRRSSVRPPWSETASLDSSSSGAIRLSSGRATAPIPATSCERSWTA